MQAKLLEVAVTIGSAMDHLDLQIHTFCEAIPMPSIKVVPDLLLPVPKRVDKRLQGFEPAGFDPFNPVLQFLLCAFPVDLLMGEETLTAPEISWMKIDCSLLEYTPE